MDALKASIEAERALSHPDVVVEAEERLRLREADAALRAVAPLTEEEPTALQLTNIVI